MALTAASGVLIMRGLMAHALRDRRTPTALAQSRQVIDFKGRLSDFEQLERIIVRDLESLDEADRPPDWRNAGLKAILEFGFVDEAEALPAVTGFAEVEAAAVCQRCLEPCTLPLRADFKYLLLPAEHPVGPVPDYEVWELDAPWFRPSDLVEEVLVMAMPIAASHDRPSDCGPLAAQLGGEAETTPKAARPFADLRSMMKGND